MQRIHLCSGASFLTADDTADAVLEYVWALAQYGRHDVVKIPTRGEDGSDGVCSLLLGPATQISADSVLTDLAEPIDAPFVATLTAKAARLRDPMSSASFDVDDDPSGDPAAFVPSS